MYPWIESVVHMQCKPNLSPHRNTIIDIRI